MEMIMVSKGDEFLANACPCPMRVGINTVMLMPKAFSTGSYGWFFSGKVDIDELRTQVTVSFVVVGSKGWDQIPASLDNGPGINRNGPNDAVDKKYGPTPQNLF